MTPREAHQPTNDGSATRSMYAPGLVRMLELEPGDLSLHHCLTFHGSLENRSERARKTLIVRFFDADCRVSRDALPAGAAPWFPERPDGGLSTEAFPLLP